MSLKTTIQQQPDQTKKLGRGRFYVEQHQRTRAIKTAQCKSKNFAGITTETISEILENLLKSKPDLLIVNVSTNDFPKDINLLNDSRKIHQKCLELPTETKLVFFLIWFLEKTINSGKMWMHEWKVSMRKKDIGLIDNFILQEHHLRTKKLYLSKRGNGVFAKRILHFIES